MSGSGLPQDQWANDASVSIPDRTDMDEFAQTRGVDDLFDDEIIPVAAEEQAPAEIEVAETVETQDEGAQTVHSDAPNQLHGQGTQRARKRGAPLWQRGQGRASNSRSSRSADNPETQTVNSTERTTQENEIVPPPGRSADTLANKHVPAVRGDRSGTGGVRKVWQRELPVI